MLYDDRELLSDDQGKSFIDLHNLITAGVVGILGYTAYKRGYLKPIIKPILEVADNVSRNGTENMGAIFGAIRDWTKLRNLTPAQMALQRHRTWSAPENSIFRRENRDGMFLSDALKELRISFETGQMDFYNMRKVIRDSKDDLNILRDMISHRLENNPNVRRNYADTELSNALRQFKQFAEQADNTLRGVRRGSYSFREAYFDELINAMSLDTDKGLADLQRTGYRTLTLGDVLEFDKESKKLVIKSSMKNKVNLDMKDFETGKSFLDNINDIFSDPTTNVTSKGKVLKNNLWENMIVDPSIRIDEVGNIIDYRMVKDQRNSFIRSLSNDFRIPLTKFNPFRMLGGGQVGQQKIFGGLIAPGQYAPTLTGRAGQYSIGQFLADNFGEEYSNLPIAQINGKVFALEKNEVGNYITRQIPGKFKLYDVTNANTFMNLKATVNSQRQMANLTLGNQFNGSWDEYKKILISKGITDEKKLKAYELKYKILNQFLDFGNQEIVFRQEIDDIFRLDDFSIDEFFDKTLGKITRKKAFWTNGFEYTDYAEKMNAVMATDFNEVLGEGFEAFVSNGRKINPRMYYISKKGITLEDVYHGENSVVNYISQHFAGRDMLNPEYMTKNFNERSTILFNIFNRLSEGIGASSDILGFSNVSKGSGLALAGNFLLKRALPIYMLIQIPGMINYFSEPFFGEDEYGNPDNLGKFLARGLSKFDIRAHALMDATSITDVFKTLGELTPGSDQLNELPIIYQLGLGQTEEERRKYIESGYDPMRKGRFWGSGNTPFTGGKIMYWRPNWYRRVQADVEFSDSKWGSRQEYYSNTWYPNPVNPLAPIRHFVTDKYHYEEKHYYDRPYLESGPEGANIPIIGPMFSQTVGRIIKPNKRMHTEYWLNPLTVNAGDEVPDSIITTGEYDDNVQASNDLLINNNAMVERQRQITQFNYNMALSHSAYQAKQMIKSDYVTASGVTLTKRRILPESSIDMTGFGSENSSLPYRDYDRYGHPYENYITPSGGMTIVDVPDEMNLYNVNKDLQKWSINRIIGTQQRVNVIDNFQGGDIPQGNDSEEIDNAFITQGIREQFKTLTDVAGLRGFAIRTLADPFLKPHPTQIENPSYAFSFKKTFWDMNLGGLGGNISEISRRFMVKPDRDIKWINPVRNTMPAWMPGSDYFVMDFKHGDPYSKIDNGEERLPGEGYERLYNIGNVMDMGIGSSYLGYSKEDIARHLIGQEGYMSSFEQDTLNKGTNIHGEIERNWLEAGFALKTEGQIIDKQNNIIGYYDAMIHDPSSATGIGIVDIKTTNAKKLDEIRLSGKPLEHHQKQVNYYLWATNNKQSKGYIYYVDKDNLENSYMVGFDYSDKLLRESLNNLYDARKDIRDALEKGIIGRGDLYKPLDKVRILADVAPYSQEYKDALAEIKQTKIDSETQEELSEIHKRVTQQKEPLRVYDYKFKTSNVITETVTVKEIVDNNTIKVKEYGNEHSIKFAGIHVTEDNTTLYNPKEEEYVDKAGRKRKHKVGKTLNEAAYDEITRYIRPGKKIQIQYDADLANKFSKDSTSSIRANIISKHTNVNRRLLKLGFATEKENDDSPAAIHARYTTGEIQFGSFMERTTHLIGRTPFINKIMQVRSPYEQYKNKEVYGKDFQSWNRPISSILIPNLEKDIANGGLLGIAGIAIATYIGSLFGENKFGKLVGGTIGFTASIVGKGIAQYHKEEDRDWRPRRRVKQEELNEYYDTLKYVKYRRLYEEYKEKAKVEDDFDVNRYIISKTYKGELNKKRQKELQDFKKFFKLDFEHRSRYNFKYGKPIYADIEHSDKKTLIHDINLEITELQNKRKVEKVPLNAIKALQYKEQMDKTMFAYEPGDSLVNIMSALPKKERQYFKHFMDAPEEEKEKILRIAPRYLRRALQSTWGLKVDEKPTLEQYFSQHALPDASWVGWQENTNFEDLKVKLVHANKLDPGEFDIWENNEESASKVNIPIPNINKTSSRIYTQRRLSELLRSYNIEDVQMSYVNSSNPSVNVNIYNDSRQNAEQRINSLSI